MVIATQNPIEHQGTYPLPEAQLDRFLFKHVMNYPSRDEERAIVTQHGSRLTMPDPADLGIVAVADLAELTAMRAAIEAIHLKSDIVDYVVDIIRASRETPALQYGASPRAGNMLAMSARAFAALQGRDYVIPDDVKTLAPPALRHRLVLAPGSEIEGLDADKVVGQILDQVPAPR
jgi:MoxR-like ATPase